MDASNQCLYDVGYGEIKENAKIEVKCHDMCQLLFLGFARFGRFLPGSLFAHFPSRHMFAAPISDSHLGGR